MKTLKKFLNWLFADFCFYLYELAEQKFTLRINNLRVTKRFTPSSIMTGVPSQLKITVTNLSGITTMTGLTITDNYPLNLKNTSTPNPVLPAGGVLVSGSAGGTDFIWTLPTLVALTSVISTINVTSDVAGEYTNTAEGTNSAEEFATGTRILTVTAPIPPVNKKRRGGGIGAPFCFNTSFFANGICPLVFDYNVNGRIIRLYRIGETCCYTIYPPNKI